MVDLILAPSAWFMYTCMYYSNSKTEYFGGSSLIRQYFPGKLTAIWYSICNEHTCSVPGQCVSMVVI